jgi:hypothetical protein
MRTVSYSSTWTFVPAAARFALEVGPVRFVVAHDVDDRAVRHAIEQPTHLRRHPSWLSLQALLSQRFSTSAFGSSPIRIDATPFLLDAIQQRRSPQRASEIQQASAVKTGWQIAATSFLAKPLSYYLLCSSWCLPFFTVLDPIGW